MRLRGPVWLALLAFALLPYFVLISRFSINFEFDSEEFFWVLKNSVFQSFVSATLSLFVAFFLSFGLRVRPRTFLHKLMNFSCLVPFFLPPLFTVLALMAWVQPFPMGIWSVIAVHFFVSVGFCSLQLARVRESRFNSISDTCQVLGVSRWQFQRSIFFPLARRDLGLLWLLIFFQSFSSFAVPLLVGGGEASSLEILIYELIRIQSNWGAAIGVSLIQALIVFSLGYFVFSSRQFENVEKGSTGDSYFVNYLGMIFPFSLLVVTVGLFKESSWVAGMDFLSQPHFFEQMGGSLALGFGTSFGVYVFLFLLGFVWREGFLSKFFLKYSGPTPALTGFSVLLILPTVTFGFYLQSILALMILSLPFFMRSEFGPLMKNFERQREVGMILGSSDAKIYFYLVWPQLHPLLVRISGLVGIWAMGDFSVSRLLATRDHTLALQIESLTSHYRLDQGISLSLILILLMSVYFILWKGLFYVARQAIEKRLW